MNLTEKQRQAIESLAKSPLADTFYWTGGTLLAVRYLQHRRSEDLDFFSETPFTFDEINRWVQEYKNVARFTNVQSQKIFDRWEFLFENGERLRIEFVHYNHEKKTLHARERFMGVLVDSMDDVAANKTMAYIDRNEPKDVFDLYFLLTKGKFTSGKLLECVEQKFGVKIPENLFWSQSFKAKALSQIQPLLLEESEQEKTTVLERIQTYFQEESRKFLNRQLQ